MMRQRTNPTPTSRGLRSLHQNGCEVRRSAWQ